MTEYNDKTPRSSTMTDYRSRINSAMKFIWENSSENLNIKKIAETANFSPYHFHRIFSCFVGETPADFIKKVRLKKAASLLNSGFNINEVALEAGYQTASGFSKIFRKSLGLSPSQFKGLKEPGNTKFKFSTPTGFSCYNSNLKPRIIEDPAHTLFYIRMKINDEGLFNDNIGEAFHINFNRWYEIIETLGLWTNIHRRIGVFRSIDSVCSEKGDYDAGFIFKKKIEFTGFDEVKQVEINPGRWAVFGHKGPYNTLWQTWNRIYYYWAPLSRIEFRGADPYEVYLNYKSTTSPNDLLTEIYIPIR